MFSINNFSIIRGPFETEELACMAFHVEAKEQKYDDYKSLCVRYINDKGDIWLK